MGRGSMADYSLKSACTVLKNSNMKDEALTERCKLTLREVVKWQPKDIAPRGNWNHRGLGGNRVGMDYSPWWNTEGRVIEMGPESGIWTVLAVG